MSVINTIKENIKETINEVKEELKNQMETEDGQKKVNPLYVALGAAAVGGAVYLGVKHFKKDENETAAKPEDEKKDQPEEVKIPNNWAMNKLRGMLNEAGLDICVLKKEETQTEDKVIEPEIVEDKDKK